MGSYLIKSSSNGKIGRKLGKTRYQLLTYLISSSMSKIRLTCSRRLAVNLTAPTACRSILPSRPCLRCNRSLTITSVRHQSTLRPSTYTLNSQTYETDDNSNTPPSIISKLQRKLHLLPNHPISILRQIVESHFGSSFTSISPTSPIVSVHQNFEELGFAPDHPGRSLTDSYYLNKEYMLRTHTSAHEVETYRRGLNRWLLSADVYRRDEIDASHYPVFHQMEGTQIWPSSELSTLSSLNTSLEKHLAGCNLIIEDPTQIGPSNPYQKQHNPKHAEQIARHLKNSLNSLIWKLFGPVATKDGEPLKIRWIEAFFPFTTPSYEVEIWWNGEWLELLGCGVVMQKTLDQAGESASQTSCKHTSLPDQFSPAYRQIFHSSTGPSLFLHRNSAFPPPNLCLPSTNHSTFPPLPTKPKLTPQECHTNQVGPLV